MRDGQGAGLGAPGLCAPAYFGDNAAVRILFCFTGGSGHALPMMPTARAVAARGHDVLFACQPAMLDMVRRTGFGVVDSGGVTLAPPKDRLPLVRTDRITEMHTIRDVFAGRIARERARRVLGVAEDYRPDIVVHDEMDFGAAVAAERCGIPHVSVIVLAAGGMITPGLVNGALNTLRGDYELPPDSDFLDRYLTLVPVMPSFRDPEMPPPARSLAIRPDVLDHREVIADPVIDRLDSWLGLRPSRPLVYFTLGTVFHQESGDLFTRVLAGLESLPANFIVTVGREIDPAELGARRENVHVERFVPQRAIVPRASVVVTHGGSGTVVSSLACGVPLVLLPMGADQPLNADRCEALGVGRSLDALTVSSNDVADAVDGVLASASYRLAARDMQREAESLPPADSAADAIERLS